MMKTIINFLFFSFLLLNPALAQTTAAILPEGKTQFLDNNGNPLSSGKVFFYVPSTTTFKTTWQDAAKTIANTNPVTLDAGGRAIIYGDGIYRQIVRTSANVTIYDALTASTGAGGGTPTAFGDGAAVGSIKPWAGLTPPINYVYSYGQELSRTTYAALFSAITLTQSLSCSSGSPILTGLSDTSQIPVGSVLESTCIAAGSTVISKATTTVTMNTNSSLTTATTGVFFLYGNGNGTTTFNVPDLRGNVIAGRCNMGGVDCTNLTVTGLGETASATGAVGGNQTKTITVPNLPPYSPTGSVTAVNATGTVSTPTITLSAAALNNINNGTGTPANLTGGGGALNSGNITASSSTPTFTGTGGTGVFTSDPQGGTSTPFSLVQPTMTLNYVIKILPDVSLSTTSVVTSLGTMTGDITCGTWLVCSSNNIAVSVNPAGAATILMNPTASTGTANLFTIQGLTNQVAPDPNNDFVPLYNAATGTIQKVSAGVLSSIGVAGVSSFNGRTGGVVPTIADYTAAIVNYTPPSAGASTRTTAARFNDVIHLADYGNNGAVCNGVADDLATFNRAVAASNALSSGGYTAIILPYGNCRLSGAVNLPDRIAIIGQGKGTNISTTSVNADVFLVTGGNVIIRDLQINTTVTRSGGAYIDLQSGGGTFSNLNMAGAYYGVIINGGSTYWTFQDITMTLVVFQGFACSGTTVIDFGVIERVVVSGVNKLTSDSGYWTDSCGDVMISNSQFLGFIRGMTFDAAAAADIADNMISSVVLDSNGQYGLYIRANPATGSVSRNTFTGLKTTSGQGNGIDIGDTAGLGRIDGLYFSQLMVDNNGNLGIKADTTGAVRTMNLQITSGQIAGNGNSGIQIGAGVTDFLITGTKIGAAGSWPQNGGAGVVVTAGASDRYVISHNNLYANGAGSLIDGGAGVNKVVGNNICNAGVC